MESVFTTSGFFTVPKGIDKVKVFCVGGGSGGGGGFQSSSSSFSFYSGDGGGGGYTSTGEIDTASIDQLAVNIGVGGGYVFNGSATIHNSPSATSVGSISAKAGGNGKEKDPNGGSAGGKGCRVSEYNSWSLNVTTATDGASDGASTYYEWYIENSSGGIHEKLLANGQGTTTRAFGESDGTLYSGGGGGGGRSGGSGGGGNGGSAGAANTGGGGGGGNIPNSGSSYGAFGGSGIAIIRW